MATFEQRFRSIEREYPYNSSLVNFSRALKGQEISFSRRVFYFRKLVDKDDYAKEDYREIRDLYCLKNATQKQGYFGGLGAKTAVFSLA